MGLPVQAILYHTMSVLLCPVSFSEHDIFKDIHLEAGLSASFLLIAK
jgi:hypothetical protein